MSVLAQDLVLSVSSSATISIPNQSQVLVGDTKIIRVKSKNQQLQIVGVKPGTTTLTMGPRHQVIHVLSLADHELYKQMRERAETMLGLRVRIESGIIYLSGELLRFDDYLELQSLTRIGGQFRLDAKVDEDVQLKVLSHIRTQQVISGLAPIPITFIPRAIASLSEQHQDNLQNYQSVLSRLGAEVVVSKKAVELEPLVRVKILVAEVRQQALQKLGLQWPTETRAEVLESKNIQLGGLEWILHTLETEGKSQILASPTLLTRSGELAEFHAGGEFPIKMVARNIATVTWKQHGIILKIKPRADSFGRMSIFVQTEVSMLDTSQTVDGVPGLLTNRLQSHLDLERSQTIALSGLIKDDWGSTRSGLPFLLRIPVLGRLFGSKDYRSQKTELVIFVTPEIFQKNEDPRNHIPKELSNDIRL